MALSNAEKQRRYKIRHPERVAANNLRWKLNNPERTRRTHQKASRRYIGMIDPPDGVYSGPCEICNRDGQLYVDHDHATGKVRGRVCLRCNTSVLPSIEKYLSDPSFKATMDAYLERTKCLA